MTSRSNSSRAFAHPHRFRAWLTVALDVLIAAMSIGAWLYMFLGPGAMGLLSGAGFVSLRYYTILSNLFVGLASLYCLTEDLRVALNTGEVHGRAARSAAIPGAEDTSAVLIESGALGGVLTAYGRPSPGARRRPALRIIASATVMVTLTVVLTFLGPTKGYAPLFAGPSLFLHLVVPLVALVNCIVSRAGRRVRCGVALLAMIPTVLYGAYYIGNILINGIGEGPATNDWYGFTIFGWKFVPVVYVAAILLTGLFGLILFLLGEPLNICHLCSPMYRKVAIRQAFFVFRVAPCSSKFTDVVRCSPVHFSSFLDFSKKGNKNIFHLPPILAHFEQKSICSRTASLNEIFHVSLKSTRWGRR